jgi:ketosteroid isomerase-like protein
MFTAAQGAPGARLAGEVFSALQTRAWDRLQAMVVPGVRVDIRARPQVHVIRNEHVWRSRSLCGREQLREYLVELNHAVPGLAMQPRRAVRHHDHEVIRTDCAGVDSAGSPFDAVVDFSIWVADGRLARLEANILEMAVGTEVIRHTEGDPRRYFQAFLGEGAA